MTKCIAKSVMQKNKLYKKYFQYPTEKNEKRCEQYKNKLNHVIKATKKKHYEEQFIKYKHGTKVLWKTLNGIMNRNKKSRCYRRNLMEIALEKKILIQNQ